MYFVGEHSLEIMKSAFKAEFPEGQHYSYLKVLFPEKTAYSKINGSITTTIKNKASMLFYDILAFSHYCTSVTVSAPFSR